MRSRGRGVAAAAVCLALYLLLLGPLSGSLLGDPRAAPAGTCDDCRDPAAEESADGSDAISPLADARNAFASVPLLQPDTACPDGLPPTVVLGLEALAGDAGRCAPPPLQQRAKSCTASELGIGPEADEPGAWHYGNGTAWCPTAWESSRPAAEQWGGNFTELLAAMDGDGDSTLGGRRQMRLLILGDSLIRVFLPVLAKMVLAEARRAAATPSDEGSTEPAPETRRPVDAAAAALRRLLAFDPREVAAYDLETQDITMAWPRGAAAFADSPVQIVFYRAFLLDDSFPLSQIRVPFGDPKMTQRVFQATHIVTNRAHDYGVAKGWHDANVPVARIPSTLDRLHRHFPRALVFFYGVLAAQKPLRKASKYQVCERRHHIGMYRAAERYAVALANTAAAASPNMQQDGAAAAPPSSSSFSLRRLTFFVALSNMAGSVRHYQLCTRRGDGWHYTGRPIHAMAAALLRHMAQAQWLVRSGTLPAEQLVQAWAGGNIGCSADEQGAELANRSAAVATPLLDSVALEGRPGLSLGALHVPLLRQCDGQRCAVESRRQYFASLLRCKPTSVDIRGTHAIVAAAVEAHTLLAGLASAGLRDSGGAREAATDEPKAETRGEGPSLGGGAASPGGQTAVLAVPLWMAYPPLSPISSAFAAAFAKFVKNKQNNPKDFASPATCGAAIGAFRDVVGDVHEFLQTGIRTDLMAGVDSAAPYVPLNTTTAATDDLAQATLRPLPASPFVDQLVDCVRFVHGAQPPSRGSAAAPHAAVAQVLRRRMFGMAVEAMRTEHLFSCKKDLAVWLLLAADDRERQALLEAVSAHLLRSRPGRGMPRRWSRDAAIDMLGCNEQDSFDDTRMRRELLWPVLVETDRLRRVSAAGVPKALVRAADACGEYMAHVGRPGSDFSLALRRFVLAKCAGAIARLAHLQAADKGGGHRHALQCFDSTNLQPTTGNRWETHVRPVWHSKEALREFIWNCTGRAAG